MKILQTYLLAALFLLLLVLATNCAKTEAPTAEDEQAIRALIQRFQDGWNNRDPAGMAACFTSDGDQIILGRTLVSGRTAIENQWRQSFAQRAEGTRIAITVKSIRFVTPAVAILNGSALVSYSQDAEGKEPQHRDRGTYMLVKQAGQWSIEALRVVEAESQ